MKINGMIGGTSPLGKGEVVSSILPGSTIKRALRIEAFRDFSDAARCSPGMQQNANKCSCVPS
jgi:hypothetical protein